MSALRVVRYGLWIVVAVVIVAAGTYWLTQRTRDGDTMVSSLDIGGPFSLTDQHGATVTEASLQGHPSALFFGYTFCPDVCPTTLADMTVWMSDLGAGADKLKIYFITIDPERDSQDVMGNYLKAFDPRIEGLTGPRPAIDQIIKDYRVYARKVDGVNGAPYTMDHTATVYLLNDKAQFSGTIDYQEKPDIALAKLKRLTGT